MQRALALMLSLGLAEWVGAHARTLVLNVATNGNDVWSGLPTQPNYAGTDGPLATLAGALKASRAIRQQYPGEYKGVSVLLHHGRFELQAPVTLTPEDSGHSADYPLVIAAYPGTQPVLSGGRALTGWTKVPARPEVWQAEVPTGPEGAWHFRQLFVNGQRKQRARTPNQGFYRIQGESPQDKPVQLKFAPGEVKPDWATAGDVEVHALLAWADLRMEIRSVDATNHVATLAGDPRPSNREANARYHIENAPDGLDQPGEWYLDRRTNRVTYWPGFNEDLTQAEVVAPALKELLVFQGDAAAQRPVRHVVVRGIQFADTDWTLGPEGYADVQAAVEIRGDIRAEAATDCLIEDCGFTRLAGYGIELGRGCQRFRITGNEFLDLGAGGVRVGETVVREDPQDACHGHVIADNHLSGLGRVYPSAVGVLILQSGQNVVAHNRIHDLYYTAISVGWNWGYQETPCRENRIEFNHLYDLGQHRLSDLGAIYTLGIQKGTLIHNNLIHDVNASSYGGWGLYTDEGSSEIVLESNVVFRCQSAGFHQHYGRGNIVRNNVFALNGEHQLIRSREEEHISFIFERNIVYFDSGALLGGQWSSNKFELDRNVYFDARPDARPDTMRFAGATFAEWQQRGHDLHSRITNPFFVSPKRLDFRLKVTSPALRMGFQPIDLGKVGVRPKRQRY